MNLFRVAGCANHQLWKHCNKSCLLILINHKQWCTVNMFQQHYQRRGGFLLFLSLRENIVITPWRCKRAKLFRVFTFLWHLNKDIECEGEKENQRLSIIHMLMCTPWKGCDISNSTRYYCIWGPSFFFLVERLYLSSRGAKSNTMHVCLLKGMFSQQNVN